MRKDWGFGDYRRPASFVPGENRWSRSAEGEEGEERRERPRRIEIERKKPEEKRIPRRKRRMLLESHVTDWRKCR